MMNTWKKAGALFFTGVFAFGMCMGVSAEEQTDVVVFAAASMTETLTEIQEMYKEVAPNVTLVFTFDSSGTLKTQIQEGADCDLFISAAQKQMNQLDNGCRSGGERQMVWILLIEGTRINLLENKVVLAVPDGNPTEIQTFADLGTDKLCLFWHWTMKTCR